MFSKERFDKGIKADEKELERIFANKNTKKRNNSHSHVKRPEPSDGFLKYLEDEVSSARKKTATGIFSLRMESL